MLIAKHIPSRILYFTSLYSLQPFPCLHACTHACTQHIYGGGTGPLNNEAFLHDSFFSLFCWYVRCSIKNLDTEKVMEHSHFYISKFDTYCFALIPSPQEFKEKIALWSLHWSISLSVLSKAKNKTVVGTND